MGKEKEYFIRFETLLNASMSMTTIAKSYKDAIQKIKKEFPTAFNYDYVL